MTNEDAGESKKATLAKLRDALTCPEMCEYHHQAALKYVAALEASTPDAKKESLEALRAEIDATPSFARKEGVELLDKGVVRALIDKLIAEQGEPKEMRA